MEKIYGNKYLLSTLESMISSGKTTHTVLFHGEIGRGKKLIAKYYTMQLLCEDINDGKPCGMCNSCRNIDDGFHPDVIYAEKSGKLGGFSIETVRKICNDAFIKPNNNSGRKVYIFTDCNKMDSRPQNALLKLIEEPPDYAYFIFTSNSCSDFLPTIISRCSCFGVSACTEEESRTALAEKGFGVDEINNAVNCFHGNIGMCERYIYDENLRNQVDLTKRLAESIIKKDEYELNVAFYSAGKERSDVKNTLSMLDKLIRDAAVLNKDSNAADIGCYRDGVSRLSNEITPFQAIRIHQYICKAWEAVEHNVTIPLILAALCSEIIEVIE